MASTSHCPLWSRHNPDQQFLVSSSQKYSQLLTSNTAELCSSVRIVNLWIYLISLGVINRAVQDDLKSRPINHDQVAALLDYLLQSPCWRLHGFLKALCMDDQGHILSQVLHLNPEHYDGDQQDQDQAAHRKQLKQEIKDHHGVYHRTLMQGSLFNIPSLDLPYNMEPCYIQLVATEDGFLRNPEDILPTNILKPKPHKARPKTALLSGPPGAGKSSFIRFFVYKCIQQDDGSSDWDLIVILNVSTLQLTPGRSPREHIKEAIQQSLEGRGDKKAIMKSLDNDNLDILIIPDGMDEVRSSAILEMLKELTSSCHKGKLGFTVLSTCRSGLSQIKDSLYDRIMKLDGFKIHEGVEYVRRFYQKIQRPADDSILDYITNNAEELSHILTNPLSTHILSVVTADGTLKLVKGQRLRLKELFNAMEQSMRRRQLEKVPEEGSDHVLSKGEIEVEIKRFYNMSVWALLKDVRTFDDGLLSLFKISAQHPYFTFLRKVKVNSFLTQDSHWKFTHESFHEFFSTCGLEALPDNLLSAFILTISSDSKFRNTQRILFSVLGGDIDHVSKLSDMICVNLVTQGDSDELDSTTRQLIDDIREKAKTDIGLDDLLSALIPGDEQTKNIIDTSKAQAVLQNIRGLYEDRAQQLQQGGLLCDAVQSDADLLTHIYSCLDEVPEEHQQLVFEQSLGRIMPSTWVDSGDTHILYHTGGMRWSQVTEDSYGVVKVDIPHSLTDAAAAVQQHGQHLVTQRQHTGNTPWGDIQLNLQHDTLGLDVSRLWGAPPHDQLLSAALWSDLLVGLGEWPGTANRLVLQFDDASARGVVGFLQSLWMEGTQAALSRLLVQDTGGRLRIEVHEGHIDSESLLAWTVWYLHQDLLQVLLFALTCEISGSDPAIRQQQHTRVRSLQHTWHNGGRLFDYLTIKGAPQDSTQGQTDSLTENESHTAVVLEEMEVETRRQHQRHSCCPCQ